jgi:hypothetical protein
LPAVTVAGELPFDDDEWHALVRGDADAQKRLVARFLPSMRLKFEASLRDAELVAAAEEETFRRVFRFFLAGHTCSDEVSLVSLIHTVCGHVILEIQRSHDFLRSAE